MLLQFMISFLLEWPMENEIPNSFLFSTSQFGESNAKTMLW